MRIALLIASALLAAADVRAMPARRHPLLRAIQRHPGVLPGLAGQLRAAAPGRPQSGDWRVPVGRAERQARRLALALIAHREELPIAALSRVLEPELARAVHAASMEPEAAARIRAGLDVHAPEGFARLSSRLRRAFRLHPFVRDETPAWSAEIAPVVRIEQLGWGVERAMRQRPHEVLARRGSVAGRPAAAVDQDGRTLVAVMVGRARAWVEASALARGADLGGSWDLPDQVERQILTQSRAVDIAFRAMRKDMRPLWTRDDFEDYYQPNVSTLFASLGDSHHRHKLKFSVEEMKDTERRLAEFDASIEAWSRGGPRPEHYLDLDLMFYDMNAGLLRAMEEGGFPVYAVSWRAAATPPAPVVGVQ